MSAGLPRVHSRPRPHYGEPVWLDRLIGAIEGLTDAIRGDVPVHVALDSLGDGVPHPDLDQPNGVRITDSGMICTGEDGSAAVDLTTAGATNDRQWRVTDPRPGPRPGPLARFPLSEEAAARIRDARLRQGVDQREFVRRHRAAGVYWSSAVQSNIERAQRRSTRGDMDALTAALGVEFTLAGGEWQ